MSITTDFEQFCNNLRMPDALVDKISSRYKNITQRINLDFRGLNSDTAYSFYTGSYGRGTETKTSDIDMIVILPYQTYLQYNGYSWNGQSALLQSVKNSLQKTYSSSAIGGDGQVVVISFSDGIRFEVVPAFENRDGSYTYPDSNNGGQWQTMDPKAEIRAFNKMNDECNHNLKRLCRMARAWNAENNVFMKGILIDTTAYRFMSNYEYRDKSYTYYDWMSRDFMQFLYDNADQSYWTVPGSNWHVTKTYSFKRESKEGVERCKSAIEYDSKNMPYSAHSEWRKHYGSKFPTS